MGELLYTFMLLCVGALVGILSPFQIRIVKSKSIEDRLRMMHEHFEEVGENEMAEIVAKTLAGVPHDEIVKDMSPQVRERYEMFLAHKKGKKNAK